ncbi:MAG: P-II family nitrogen regulator [Oscillospiraceae bacterium]|nr:P-II family nitrogen regulator [Oscillospiraceae bacterium]
MSELYLMTTVIDRKQMPRFVALYQMHGILTSFISLGRGTFTGERAGYLFGQSEKAVCFSLVTRKTWRAAKRGMQKTLHIDVPGVGVAFIMPMSSIGGRRELAFLTEGQNFERGEESTMQGTDRELIVIIGNQGYSEMIMDAARAAGAYGGTIVNARGTGMERAEKFLGISLASEKDMIFIVAKTAQRDAIMQSVMFKAGMETPAKAIAFSLPVADTAGLRLVDEDEEDAEPAEPRPEAADAKA